ncbi:DUF6364 family protein [Tunicatimonas pelagia]|uniref:DUF6364 family protein n=1 Tax=Tunicatimonas pelagia TaxID=931531 RepID=UPI002666D605|nr:DUF6364 family protein [Tunicatimonas pelagia]WKN40801.1 DUF6364 family protein [Tunicatimonas pelagia]
MSKLTLSINQSVIEEAKAYAKASGKSLSSIVEEYLKSLSKDKGDSSQKHPSSIVNELKGSVRMPKDFSSYKELLEDALIEKYLKK